MKKFFFLLLILMGWFSYAQQVHISNLGKNVNSRYAELNPIISQDGKTLYFIRSNHPENNNDTNGSQDIWSSHMDEDGQWEPAMHEGTHLNFASYNTLFNVSPDQNRMLVGGSYSDGILWGPGFSMIERNGKTWSLPRYLDIKRFDVLCRGEYSTATLLPDNKTLVLSFSNKEESKINDLFVSFLQANNKWGEPVNLGSMINTAYDETTPFIAADGVTLYFSSDRPGGIGSNDIYMSRRLDDTWTKWSPPVNLGAPVNSKDWEGYYTIPASGEKAYFVSYLNSFGKADIMTVETRKTERPRPVLMITGKVIHSKTQKPVEAEITYEILPEGKLAGKANFLGNNGDYQLLLPYGKNYGVSAKANGFIPVSLNIDLTATGEYKVITKDLEMVPIETGSVIRLNNIFFNTGRSELSDASFPELNRLAEIMNNNPDMSIEIAGHTDNTGKDEDNLRLSDERALSVKYYLVGRGIKDKRVVNKGYGKTQPTAPNDTEEGRKLNRRVEFRILNTK